MIEHRRPRPALRLSHAPWPVRSRPLHLMPRAGIALAAILAVIVGAMLGTCAAATW